MNRKPTTSRSFLTLHFGDASRSSLPYQRIPTSPFLQGCGYWRTPQTITAVAGIFSEFQWSLLERPVTALIGLRGAYMDCFRAPAFDSSTRLKALQYAATYYVLYHAQLIWNASKNREVVEKIPPNFLPISSSTNMARNGVAMTFSNTFSVLAIAQIL